MLERQKNRQELKCSCLKYYRDYPSDHSDGIKLMRLPYPLS